MSSGAMVVVPAGSLDTEVPNVPDGNIFTASRASWDRDLSSAEEFPTFPK